MLQRTLVFILLIATVFFPYGQKRSTPKSWRPLYEKAEELYSNPAPTDETDSLALEAYKQVITILKENQEADTLFFKPYLYAGSLFYNRNDLDSAAAYYKQAELILQRYPSITESERLYNKLGALFYETGDYRKSIPYFFRALQKVEEQDPEDSYFVVNYRNNIASALRKLGYTDSAITIYKSLLRYHIQEDKLLHNIGLALLDENKNEEALYYLKNAGYENPGLFNNLAVASLRLNKKEEANSFINRALSFYKKAGNNAYDYDYANTMKIEGDLLMTRNQETRRFIDTRRRYWH